MFLVARTFFENRFSSVRGFCQLQCLMFDLSVFCLGIDWCRHFFPTFINVLVELFACPHDPHIVSAFLRFPNFSVMIRLGFTPSL